MNVSAASITAHADQLRVRQATGTTVSASGWVDSSVGPLSTKELTALRAAVGYDFAWPPTSDGPIPMAALQLAWKHSDEMSAHIQMQEMTSKDLDKLATAGLIDSAGAARGAAVLNGQGATDAVASVMSAETSSQARPVSGSVAADGSRYL